MKIESIEYLSDDFEPVGKDEATLVKVFTKDGRVIFAFPTEESKNLESRILAGLEDLKQLAGDLLTTFKQRAPSGQNRYERRLRGFVQELWAGRIDKGEFVSAMGEEIGLAFDAAFAEGARSCDIEPSEYTDEERDALRDRVMEEQSHIAGFADYISEHDKESGAKLSSLWHRASMWWNRYSDVRDQAKSLACGDRKLRWQWHPEKEHCDDCRRLNGKVKRASQWRDAGIRPKMPELECGGFQCGCEFVETDEALSKGPLPSIG